MTEALKFISGLFLSLLGFYPNSYPQLQTSIAGVYLSSPRRSSGGRYHNVITLLVYGRLLEGGKRENYHFSTITLLKKWYLKDFTSVMVFKNSTTFHSLFSPAKL